MLTVTKEAATLLKAAKAAEGASDDAGIRIQTAIISARDKTIAIRLAVADEPGPGDQAIEQQGLRIFVEGALIDTLADRTLDVRDAHERVELVFR